MAFREDDSWIRPGYAAGDLSRTRRMALPLLQRASTANVGMKARCLMCGWDETYLTKVLAS